MLCLLLLVLVRAFCSAVGGDLILTLILSGSGSQAPPTASTTQSPKYYNQPKKQPQMTVEPRQ